MQDHKLAMLHSSGDCNWRTPPELYEGLDGIFHFDIDLAATAENALVESGDGNVIYLGPDHPQALYRDALRCDWSLLGATGFLNPTYSLSMYSAGLEAGVDRKDLQWLLIESWAEKAYFESQKGFTTIGVFPYAPQTQWFRKYVMGHDVDNDWSGHAALDCWVVPYRVSYLDAQGKKQNNANVNTCIPIWGPNPGFVGPWQPSLRYWSYR